MGFSSEGEGMGSTFYFELPLYTSSSLPSMDFSHSLNSIASFNDKAIESPSGHLFRGARVHPLFGLSMHSSKHSNNSKSKGKNNIHSSGTLLPYDDGKGHLGLESFAMEDVEIARSPVPLGNSPYSAARSSSSSFLEGTAARLFPDGIRSNRLISSC
jgi:hypothetical protein